MKKLTLILFALTFSLFRASAITLNEAYRELASLPRVTTVTNDTTAVTVDSKQYNGIMQSAKATGLNREEIKATGNATFAILNQIPLSCMINGGSNGLVAAFVYCTPNETGSNDMLIVTMSGEQGDLTYLYITNLDEAQKLYIQEAKLTMEGNSLSIIPSEQNGFIGAIKANCK